MPQFVDDNGNPVDEHGQRVSGSPPAPWLARKTTEYLPTIGATGGGLVAGPPGAGLGAIAGEAGRQLLTSHYPSLGTAPQTGIESLGEMAYQGGLGWLTEVLPVPFARWLKESAPLKYARVFGKVGEELTPDEARAIKGYQLTTGKHFPGLVERAKEGIFRSRQSMARYATKSLEKNVPILKGMEAEATKGMEQIDPAATLQKIDELINKLYVEGLPAAQGSSFTRSVHIGREPQVQLLTNLKQQLEDYTSNGLISRESFGSVKRNIDRLAEELGSVSAASEEMTLRRSIMEDARRVLRHELYAPRPDIEKIAANVSLWTNVRKLLDPSTGIATRTATPWEKRAVVQGIAGGSALGLGGSRSEAAGAVVGVYLLDKLFSSTAWKTTSAVTRNLLADLLARGDVQAASRLAERILAQETRSRVSNLAGKLTNPARIFEQPTEEGL